MKPPIKKRTRITPSKKPFVFNDIETFALRASRMLNVFIRQINLIDSVDLVELVGLIDLIGLINLFDLLKNAIMI